MHELFLIKKKKTQRVRIRATVRRDRSNNPTSEKELWVLHCKEEECARIIALARIFIVISSPAST